MIYGRRDSAKRVRNGQLLADPKSRGILDFCVPRHGAGALGLRIVIDAVLAALAKQHATMRGEVADQVRALHISRDGNGNLFTSHLLALAALTRQVTICLKQNLDRVPQVVAGLVNRVALGNSPGQFLGIGHVAATLGFGDFLVYGSQDHFHAPILLDVSSLKEEGPPPANHTCCTLSRMKLPSLALLLALAAPLSAQHLVPQKTFDAIATEFSGEAAQENDRAIVQYHRIQGSPMMAEVAEKVVLQKLQAWGIEAKIEQFPSDGKIAYSKTHITPMGWDMRGGELWVEGVAGETNFSPVRLCRYSDVPMCVSTYSKGGDWSGELVEVGAGTKDKDYEDKDVRGKVALAYGYAAAVAREAALKHGAIGVVIYPPPGDRADHPDMVRYNGTWPIADEYDKTVGGFQISQNQYTQLQGWMRRGAVRVHGKIDATLGAGQLTLVNAWIRGTTNPQTEILITGHLDHPKWSANDNASGSATMMEMVRTLHALIAAGKLPAPTMTLHFLWVPEYEGTIAYLANHPEIRSCNPNWDDPRPNALKSGPCVAMDLNLDMTGEDTVKTRSRFYFTRTPDSVRGPSERTDGGCYGTDTRSQSLRADGHEKLLAGRDDRLSAGQRSRHVSRTGHPFDDAGT